MSVTRYCDIRFAIQIAIRIGNTNMAGTINIPLPVLVRAQVTIDTTARDETTRNVVFDIGCRVTRLVKDRRYPMNESATYAAQNRHVHAMKDQNLGVAESLLISATIRHPYNSGRNAEISSTSVFRNANVAVKCVMRSDNDSAARN
jgi:hypothetical protein